MDPKYFQVKLPSSICAIGTGAGDGLGGGGGGEKPEFDPEKFKKEIEEYTLKAVNGAISTHLTRQLDKRFDENNTTLVGQFKELLDANKGAAPPPPEPPAGNPDLAAQIKNATAPLERQLAEQKATAERAAAAATAANDAASRQEEETALQNALIAAGVAAPLASAAVGQLHGKIARDTQGAITFVSKETGPSGPYDETVTVGEGVARFLKTDDGKHFLPARQAGGAGNQGGRPPAGTPAGGQETDHDFVGRMLGF